MKCAVLFVGGFLLILPCSCASTRDTTRQEQELIAAACAASPGRCLIDGPDAPESIGVRVGEAQGRVFVFEEVPTHAYVPPASEEAEGTRETWMPSCVDVDALEAAIHREACDAGRWHGPPPAYYARQYYGTYLGERRVVVAKFFDPQLLEFGEWKRHLIGVDDGGWSYVLVVFDPANDELLTIRPNGTG